MRIFAAMLVFCIVPLFLMQTLAANLIEKEMRREFANAQNESLSYVIDKTRNAVRTLLGISIASDQVYEYKKFASIPEEEMLFWENIKAPYNQEELNGMYEYIMLKDKICRMLTNTMMVAPYISSVEYFDLDKGYMLNDQHEYKRMEIHDDTEMLSCIHQKGLFPIITPVRDIRGKRIVSIIEKSNNYAVGINIDMDRFEETILGSHPEYTKIMVYDDRGNYLFGTGHMDLDMKFDEIREKSSFVHHSDNLVPYWEYWSMLDLSMISSRIDHINLSIMVMAGILVIAAFVMSYIAARHLYKPAAEISRLIDNETVDEETGDIFNRMLNYVESSREEKGKMQSDIETLKPFYEERKILNLMYGHGSSAGMDYLLGEKGRYMLFTFRISSKTPFNSDEEEYLMRERITELAWGFFGEPGRVLHDYSGKYYLIISVMEGETKKIKSFAIIAREFMEEKFDAKCRVGISDFHDDPSSLPLAKKEADEALAYSVLSENSTISSIKDSRSSNLTRFDHIEHLFSLMMQQIEAGSAQAACQSIKKINEDMEQMPSSMRIGKITELLLHTLTFMLEKLSKSGLAESELAKLISEDYKLVLDSNLMKPTSDAETIINGFCELMKSGKLRKPDSIDTVLNLIEENYVRNLGLVDYADMIDMHPDYLGRCFKNKTGWSFVEYITNKRIESAKELLSNPEAKVKDVSAAVGFSNSNYFIKVFKGSTGMTPKEFQVQNAENFQTKG